MAKSPAFFTSVFRVLAFPVIVLFGDTSPDATSQSQRKALTRNLSFTAGLVLFCTILGIIHAAQHIEAAIARTQERLDLIESYGFSQVQSLEEHRLYAHVQAFNHYISQTPHRWIFAMKGIQPKPLPQLSDPELPVIVLP